MNRNIPITFILFLILVVVVSVLVENHFKNDYLGGSYFNTLLKDGHVLLTSDRELGMTFNSIKRCGFNNNQIKKAERVITPGIDKKWFNFMFLSYNFLYSENNDYYYDTKIKGFNKDINIPYVDEGNSFKYEHIFKLELCDSGFDHTSDNIKLYPLKENSNKLNEVVLKFESTNFLNRYPLESYNFKKDSYELGNYDDKILLKTIDDTFSIFKSNQFRNPNFEKELFTPERMDYIWFFQYYAKVFVYYIFIPEFSSSEIREYNIKAKSMLSNMINVDISMEKLACYPLIASYGLYICLIYDPRFGIIIACKGSEGDNEWANNFDKDGVATKVVTNNFHTVLSAIIYVQKVYVYQNKTSVKKYISNIAFTGHSLGGAVAQQLASLFVYNQYDNYYLSIIDHLHLVTFNSAGVSPFIRNMSLKFLDYNRSKYSTPKDAFSKRGLIINPLKIYNMTIRRRHDPVHQTGHIVFQSLDNYTIYDYKDFYVPELEEIKRGDDVTYKREYPMSDRFRIGDRALVIPGYSGRLPVINHKQLYDWRKDKNLTHIVLLFNDIPLIPYEKFTMGNIIKYFKDNLLKKYIPGLASTKQSAANATVVKLGATLGLSATAAIAAAAVGKIGFDWGTQYLKDIHTKNYLSDNNTLFMYYNSKQFIEPDNEPNRTGINYNSIELFRMCLELNKYKVGYIPQFLRNSNIASYVIQLEEGDELEDAEQTHKKEAKSADSKKYTPWDIGLLYSLSQPLSDKQKESLEESLEKIDPINNPSENMGFLSI